MPRAMNRQGNRRTETEGPSDLNFQNPSLLKTRLWPQVHGATGYGDTEKAVIREGYHLPGQQPAAGGPLPDFKRNFTAVLDQAEEHADDDYEDPKLHVTEAWQSVKVLPARPIKESEYADTRYFKGMMDTPLSFGDFPSMPAEGQTWTTQMRLEEVDKPISKDIRSQRVKGGSLTRRNKTPVPPPRQPVVPVPKKYQPLPPEPESSPCTFPEAQRGPSNAGTDRSRHPSSLQATSVAKKKKGGYFDDLRSEKRRYRPGNHSPLKERIQINLKNLSEVLGTEEVSHHQMKPGSSRWSQNQNAPEIPLAIASSPSMMSSHGVQSRDHKQSVQSHAPQRRPLPDSCGPPGQSVHYRNMNWRRPFPASADEEEAPQSEWYVGEYSRQAVEEALIKENKDGTFLVRDCSAKSCGEPYVLSVFHENKVYNVKIRFLERNQKFALGTGLRGSEKFNSVEDIIEHYKYFPIVLVDGKDKTGTQRKQCYLAQPLPLHRLFSP